MSPGRFLSHSNPRPRILFLDAYDSFSNNITALLTSLLDVDVRVLHIDSPLRHSNAQRALQEELSNYDAVVCGPGPGSPTCEQDLGLMKHIWTLPDGCEVPCLGVCLGFQSLALASGARIRRLKRGLHGMVRSVEHRGLEDGVRGDAHMFEGVGVFKATLYHSLCVDIGQDDVADEEWATSRWQVAKNCPDLVPLAWIEEDRQADGVERILMAVKHRSKPFWGLQYHPESICTEPEGHRVIRNWFRAAMEWNKLTGRMATNSDNLVTSDLPWPDTVAQAATRPSLMTLGDTIRYLNRPKLWDDFALKCKLEFETIPLPAGINAPDIIEILRANGPENEHIILDSSNAGQSAPKSGVDVRGRFSIIGLELNEALRIEYRAGANYAALKQPLLQEEMADHVEQLPLPNDASIWNLLAKFHKNRRVWSGGPGPHGSPFLGGFMGYVTYEQGLADIDIPVAHRSNDRPDICFAWVTKSIVLDHLRGELHIQHLRDERREPFGWLCQTKIRLTRSRPWEQALFDGSAATNEPSASSKSTAQAPPRLPATISAPTPKLYEDSVRRCQEFIAAGESYELCLTAQTTISLHRPAPSTTQPCTDSTAKSRHLASDASWQLYRSLRVRQPAPFTSYIRLGGATLISASPERFLRYNASGLCSMKPMKGTVRKSDSVSTLAAAEALLHVPKEEAENLMIVDLVRHDLHGICGAGNVTVPDLLKVEEYQSVFTMITVVEGQLPVPAAGEEATMYTGLDALAASLPPGSMTGAPKKRSCEILRQIEGGAERSLYSGVVGYMCVSGKGDWSVTIRSLFRWDDEQPPAAEGEGRDEKWRIGAGGAVTILSTPEGETEEMFTKLAGPLGVFDSTTTKGTHGR